MQRVSFGHKAHVQTTFGRVGTCHTPKFSSHFAHEAKKENYNRSHWASLTLIHERRRCSEAIARIPLSVSRRIGNRNKGQAMEIEGTTFGTITIDGKTYEHDVIIRLSGEVVKRKKKLSKKYYGTSHVLSMDEAKFIFERGCEQLILGSGQIGNVHLSPEAEAYFAKKGCKVLLQPTPEAIGVFNRSHAKKIGLFHVTC
jgi:hypothetical protein